MKTRYFARAGSAALAVLTITVVGTSLANAQSGAPVAPKVKNPSVISLANRVLQKTTFMVNTSNVTAICNTSGCLASAPVFSKSVQCPKPAGQTCTFYVHLESTVNGTADDNELFKFLVDGAAPTPGPTDSNGFTRWDLSDPNSGVIQGQARSFAVVAKVKNSSANQSHAVEVDIACEDETGDGCSATMAFASLNIGVYTP
jgi:hypothetical protein